MRWFRLLLVAATTACGARGPELPSAGPVAPADCQPLPGLSASAEAAPALNGTPLLAEPLPSPTSAMHLSFTAPELGEAIPLHARRAYSVRIAFDAAGDPSALLDVALDDGRPRRLVGPETTIALGELLRADLELAPGAHWLFAAPLAASGFVPRRATGVPRAAIARRFFVGKPPSGVAGPTGAIWLRKPEGTYNGAAAAHDVVFDVFVFSASGAAQDAPYTVALRGPTVGGELRFPSPFTVHDLPSGAYEVTVSSSSSAAMSLSTRFVVNRELGGAP